MDTTISLAENTDISSDLKVADITITDDGEGTNNLILSGADKDLFFISDDGKELFLKASHRAGLQVTPSWMSRCR